MNALWEHTFDSGVSLYPMQGPWATAFQPEKALGVTNIAATLRANPYRVPAVLAELDIVNL
jgi:hypothetical protein